MIKVSLITLIGIPGIGKTTFCEQVLQRGVDFNVVHICYDYFVKFDPELSFSYKSQRKDILDKIKELITSIKNDNGATEMFRNFSNVCRDTKKFIILIDDNNYYRSMRYDFYKIAKDYRISYAQIYFSLPLSAALSYNSLRENPIPEEVILKMNNRIENPSENNKWEKNTFVIRNTEIDCEEISNFLDRSFNVAIEVCEKICGPMEQSQLHKIDLLLRKQVGFVLKNGNDNGKSVDIRSLANHLNSKRKQMLNDLRNGVIQVQDEDFSHLINLI